MAENVRFMWGVPAKREIAAAPILDQVGWVFAEVRCNTHQLAFGRSIGNLIWVNRSFLIAQAKEYAERGFNPALLMMDTDAKPIAPTMHDALHFIAEDFRLGYDVVLAPVHTLAKNEAGEYRWFEEWKDFEGAERTEEGPWRIAGGSFTQACLSPKVITDLTKLYDWEPNNHSPIPVFCETSHNTTEDIHLCRRVTDELGLRICARRPAQGPAPEGGRQPGVRRAADGSRAASWTWSSGMRTFPRQPAIDIECLVPSDQGWMTDVEVATLTGFAFLNLARGDLLEVGCFKGRTSSALTRAGRLTVVDTFLGSIEHQAELQGRSFRSEFDANLKGATDLRVLEGNSHLVLPTLPQDSFRLILLDASHEYEDVRQDLTGLLETVVARRLPLHRRF